MISTILADRKRMEQQMLDAILLQGKTPASETKSVTKLNYFDSYFTGSDPQF